MAEWNDSFVEANGIRIHYTRGGSGPTVVLVHGFTDNGRCWTPVAEVLAAEYDVVMPDSRGHGLSDAPEQGYTTEDRAADLAALITTLGLERPVLIGHSMGGDTSAATAALYPTLMRAVVLEDPPWRPTDAPIDPQIGEQWRQRTLAQQRHIKADLIAQCRIEHPDWPEGELAPWADAKQQVRLQVFNGFNRPRNRWRDDARGITCPTLLITGDPERGAIVPPEVAQEFLSLCPHGAVAHIAGAGHNIRRERFAPYVEVVQGFLRQTTGSQA